MRIAIGLLILVLTLTVSSCNQKAQNGVIQVVTTEEMQAILALENVQRLDVRTPKEYAEGYIADFQNIDFLSPTFDQDILKLDKEKPVILYCKEGGRSAKCAKQLAAAGFVKIYDYQGGMSKWEHDELEVVYPE